MGFLYWWERSDNQDDEFDEFDDEYYEGLWGIRLTPVTPDRACAPGNESDGETRAAGEHDG